MSHAVYDPASSAPMLSAPPPQAARPGWHDVNDIHSMAGIGGTYYWPENMLAPVVLTFWGLPTFPPADPLNFTCNFTAVDSGGGMDTGPCAVLGAVGSPAAIILFGANPRSLLVNGIFTDAAHTIYSMWVQSAGSMFVPLRMF